MHSETRFKKEKIMSEKYFWREKNANKFLGKCEVRKPTKAELKKEISAKFTQKLLKITYIFDKNARNKFLEKNKSKLDFDFSKSTEEEIQVFLTQEILVDLFQLARDASKLYQIDYESFSGLEPKDLSPSQIQENIKKAISNLENNPGNSIEEILLACLSLSNMFNLSTKHIEDLRLEKENQQGNFFNGKYVIK